MCVSRCQGIEIASAAILMKDLQVGGNELDSTSENLMCQRNSISFILNGFGHSLLNLKQIFH